MPFCKKFPDKVRILWVGVRIAQKESINKRSSILAYIYKANFQDALYNSVLHRWASDRRKSKNHVRHNRNYGLFTVPIQSRHTSSKQRILVSWYYEYSREL